MSAQNGVYIPLQNPSDIRLLVLKPGQPDDPIECDLLNPMNLDALDTLEETANRAIGLLRQYFALSYVWGDQNDKRLIILNRQPFWVTYNLFSSLSRVRNLSMDMQCLWVDALCIDQNNQHEREAQVKLMSRIYRQAKAIIADVGEKSEGKELISPLLESIIDAGDTCEAIEMSLEGSSYNDPARIASLGALMNDIVESTERGTLSFRHKSEDEVKREIVAPKLEHHGLQISENKGWKAFQQFFASPYWQRIWVLQEFALAPKISILYGDLQIRPSKLMDAMKLLLRFGSLPIDTYFGLSGNKDMGVRFESLGFKGFITLMNEKELVREQSPKTNPTGWLITKLEYTKFHMSTDPRDRIYALLGLASDGESYIDAVTYSPDWKYEEVFKNFAKMFIERDHGMKLLYQAGTCSDWLKSPSWVPDWQKMDRSLNQIALPFEHSTFAASPSSSPSIHVRQDNNSLLVRGTTVDKISKKTATLGSGHLASVNDHVTYAYGMAYGLTDIISFFSSGIFLAQELDDYPTNEGSLDVALRTFLRGPPSEMSQSQMVSMQEGVRAFFSRIRLCMELVENKWREPDPETVRRGQEQEQPLIALANAGGIPANQRCFCTTEKGFFGLVPGKVEIGDEVAIFNGGNVPFILRRFEPGNERELVYRLVGDGYLHGLMHGEALSLDTYDERDLVIV
ncbi:MAG: hypothetical protein Q9167_000891 [Letrouitia subvulpina]